MDNKFIEAPAGTKRKLSEIYLQPINTLIANLAIKNTQSILYQWVFEFKYVYQHGEKQS